MRQGLYVVLDTKVVNYSMPFFSQSDQAAVRAFTDAVRQEGTLLQRHPEDFVLFRIADVDDSSASVSVPNTPVEIVRGRDIQMGDAIARVKGE